MPTKRDHSHNRNLVFATLALVLCLLSASRAYANVQICPKGGCPSRLTTIYTGANWENFTGPGGLIQDAQGNLYGTTYIGGGSSLGTVYELSPGPNGSWLEADIYTFLSCANTGCIPFPNLAMDSSGSLYGTTEYGGASNSGTVFKLTLKSGAWTESNIHSFTSAVAPAPNSLSYWNGLALNRTTGVLYGPGNNGQIWELVPGNSGWTFNVIATLSDPAIGGLVIDSSGALYGTAAGSDRGIIFALYQTYFGWIPYQLYAFTGGSDGEYPTGNLVLQNTPNWIFNGNVLYGTTSSGGSGGMGTVFAYKLPTTEFEPGTFGLFHSFSGGDGSNLKTVAVDSLGDVYVLAGLGGTYGDGAIYKITNYYYFYQGAVLWNFNYCGNDPIGFILGSDGALYGTALMTGGGCSVNDLAFRFK